MKTKIIAHPNTALHTTEIGNLEEGEFFIDGDNDIGFIPDRPLPFENPPKSNELVVVYITNSTGDDCLICIVPKWTIVRPLREVKITY